jgi:hypothetical protein
MTIDKISKGELIHYMLQAIIRDNDFCDFSYVGPLDKDHYYNFNGRVVPVSRINNVYKSN